MATTGVSTPRISHIQQPPAKIELKQITALEMSIRNSWLNVHMPANAESFTAELKPHIYIAEELKGTWQKKIGPINIVHEKDGTQQALSKTTEKLQIVLTQWLKQHCLGTGQQINIRIEPFIQIGSYAKDIDQTLKSTGQRIIDWEKGTHPGIIKITYKGPAPIQTKEPFQAQSEKKGLCTIL